MVVCALLVYDPDGGRVTVPFEVTLQVREVRPVSLIVNDGAPIRGEREDQMPARRM
jgi:hypothetical protein